jgi:hypothetical protein
VAILRETETGTAMDDANTHFMWGYQRHFRHAVEREAERVLDALKPGLGARAFLVGVRLEENGRLPPACVEPENHPWARSADFAGVLAEASADPPAQPDPRLLPSHPTLRERERQKRFRRAVRDVVVRRLEAGRGRPQDVRLFVSPPMEREGFLVLTVITVARSVLDEVPAVAPGRVRTHDQQAVRAPCSLAEAVIDQLHAKANEAMIQVDAGASLSVLGSSDQIVRQAGVEFFADLLARVDQDSRIVGVAAGVFDTLSRLALAPYEKAEPRGCLVFAEKGARVGTPVLTLSKPLPLKQAKALRKMLVLTNDDLVLRCSCEHAFALVCTSPTAAADSPSGIAVRIAGRGKWVVAADGRDVMVMSDGQPSLPQPVVDEQRLARDLRRLVRGMTEPSALGFARIGARLAASGHGGIVVVSEGAVDEAVRLGNESLPVAPVALTPDLAVKLSEIDGALLCDPEGSCHAVGVILDGRASALGDPGRGSRFNSAVRYIASASCATAAMVVSDDGGLDLLPRLRPPLARAKLAARLDELRQMALCPAALTDRDRESDVIGWIGRHAFYMDDDQCASANQWIATCEERFFKDSNLRISRRALKPDPDFDPARDLV